jgi:hypothetical protein
MVLAPRGRRIKNQLETDHIDMYARRQLNRESAARVNLRKDANFVLAILKKIYKYNIDGK